MSQDLLERILKNKVDKNLDEVIKFLITYKKTISFIQVQLKEN